MKRNIFKNVKKYSHIRAKKVLKRPIFMFEKIYFQFELRYIPVLNFSNPAKDMISPYLGMSSGFALTEENTQNQKIEVSFHGGYTIVLSNDRIVLRVASAFEGLEKPGSVIHEPFFTLAAKIADCPGFSKFNNALYFAIAVNEDDQYDNKKFMNKFLHPSMDGILTETKDCRITLERKNNMDTEALNFSPFFGDVDLRKFNFNLAEDVYTKYRDSTGLICDILLSEGISGNPTSSIFKNLDVQYRNMIDRLSSKI